MSQIVRLSTQQAYTDARLSTVLETLDELHSAASEDRLPALTRWSQRELLGWLRDVIYTAQETIAEIERHAAPTPNLSVLKTTGMTFPDVKERGG